LPTANEVLQDSAIRHAVNLQHYGNGVVKRIIKLISQVDEDLQNEIIKALNKLPPESFTVQRLEKILENLRAINQDAFKVAFQELSQELEQFAVAEANYHEKTFAKALPVQVSIASINPEQLYTAAMSQPFQGKLLKEWFATLESDKAIKIRDAIRMGYVENQPLQQIVQRIIGTRKNKYTDGILEISRRNAEAITRTALGHMSVFTRERFFEANNEVISAIRWQATLDNRTSSPCRLRDNKLYTTDHKPIGHSLPWGGGAGNFHINCRSVAVAVLKSWKELGFNIDELPPSTRQSMNGQVPADLSYGDWLKKQSAKIQDEVLGKTRAKLFREGKATIETFANNKGKLLTIQELKELDIM
jgi:hypothetical protein